jgi:hypothetical protein
MTKSTIISAIIGKRYFLFPYAFAILSCSKPNVELAHQYKSQVPSFVEKVANVLQYGKNWGWAVGSSLTLNQDSTFDMTTCGNYIKGKWNIKTDSLFLTHQQSRYRIDSFNHIPAWKAKLTGYPFVETYCVKGNYLERTASVDSHRSWMLIKMVKTNP